MSYNVTLAYSYRKEEEEKVNTVTTGLFSVKRRKGLYNKFSKQKIIILLLWIKSRMDDRIVVKLQMK